MLPFYFARRIARDRGYGHNFRERFGTLPFPVEPTAAGSIWLHAVSVGEVLSAIPLVVALREQYPQAPVYVSCTTVAGRELAETKLRPLVNGLFYAPLDYPLFVRRVLRKLRPALVVILETEIWPNLWRESRKHGAALAVVNGRISDRAFPRYKKLRWLFQAPLSFPNAIWVQSARDAVRYVAAGAPESIVHSAGNLKYDFKPPAGGVAAPIRVMLDSVRPDQIWIAASTMPPRDATDLDEDDAVIDAFRALSKTHPRHLLVLVPRRPERFDSAAAKLTRAGVRFVRRSDIELSAPPELPAVLLLDSMGELSGLFELADAIFMGGTLARRGGHNVLEPAYFGKPVVRGPHMENFDEIAREFSDAQATVTIAHKQELAPAIASLLDDESKRRSIGERAKKVADTKRGVAKRLAVELVLLHDTGFYRRGGSAWLAPLAWAWTVGLQWDRATTPSRRLDRPVISVGNMTVGGAGKTPFVEWLTGRLYDLGRQPAILTRGYRRRTSADCTLVRARAQAPVALTGDEAQIFVQAGLAHVGVGGDRFEAGTQIVERFGADALVLDDGFQHWALRRDLDIVLIDALAPFGGGQVVPRGRLREPLGGLERAGAIVITRVESGMRTAALEHEIRRYNQHAPIFRAGVRPIEWRDVRNGLTIPASEVPYRKVAAFAGLGNPAGFRRTIEQLGLDVVLFWPFGDHHLYKSVELFRLAEQAREMGAEALVTTEKDCYNLPRDLSRIPEAMPLLWLKIQMDVESGDDLMDLIPVHQNVSSE